MKSKSPKFWLWWIFIIWASVGLITVGLDIGEGMIRSWDLAPSFEAFLLTCLHWGDFTFIALACANILVIAHAYLGSNKLWTTFAIITIASSILEWVGATTGYPFGEYHYTENFGPRIGGVLPVAIPLAWNIVLLGPWIVLQSFKPKQAPQLKNRVVMSLAVAAMATAIDWVLEPFAWHVRGYWIWSGTEVPLQNYLSWFVAGFVFTLISPIHIPNRPSSEPDLQKRTWIILGLMLGIFILGRVVYGV